MSKQKGLQDVLEDVDVFKDLEREDKSKEHQSRSRHHSKQKDDVRIAHDHLKYLKAKGILGLLSSNAKRTILQATLAAKLKKISGDFKFFDDTYRKKYSVNSESYDAGAGNGAIKAFLGSFFTDKRTVEDYASMLNMLAALQKAENNGDASGDTIRWLINILQAHKQNHEHFPRKAAAADNGGDGDPEHTKATVDVPFETSFPPTDFPTYLMLLKTKASNEIDAKALTKEDNFVDFTKEFEPQLDKLSWRKRCEENSIDSIITSEEEENDEEMASPDLLYTTEEIDNMMSDQLSVYTTDSDDSVDTQVEENQDDEADNSDTNDDSGSEIDDNDGDGILPEDNGPLVQISLTVDKGIVEMESTSHDGDQELAGAERKRILPIDYQAYGGQLVPIHSHGSTYTQFKAPDTKPYLVINSRSRYPITVNEEDEVVANLTVSTNLQDAQLLTPQGKPEDHDHPLNGNNDGVNIETDPVEQTQELPLLYPSFGPIMLPPTTGHSLLQFVDTGDQPAPLPNEDPDSLTEDESEAYVDAVDAQPEDSEESCQQSAFVSPSAKDPSDQVEVLHMRVPKRGLWTDCCLL